MTKKVPISVNPEWEAEIAELGSLLGVNPDQYGWMPRVFKFSITYTLESLKSQEKSIPDLETEKLALWFTSLSKLKAKRLLLEKASKLQEKAEKV